MVRRESSCCSFDVLSELAASAPRTEVVEKGEYFWFGMRDSLTIEASFLQVVYLFSFVGHTCCLEHA